MEATPVTWRSRLKRWRWWIAAVVVLIAVRMALPLVLRRVVAQQASDALHARVEVGDVDLALWKGGVALDDVAVFESGPGDHGPGVNAGEVAARPANGEASSASQPATPDSRPPIIAFKRFAAELHYLPLFSKTIQLRDVALDSPRVALDRLASGDLNLMALVPRSEVAVAAATPGATEAAASPTPTAAAGETATTWKFGLDRFLLRDGRLRFRDLTLKDSEPIEVGIDQVAVQEIALSPGVYGEPAQLHVKLGLENGVIDVAAQLRLLEQGFAVTCDLKAERLPLRQARLYVPTVGWSELKGELDMALTYALQTDTKNELHGTLGLRDVAVTVPQLKDVALAWKDLAVDIETVDLLAQRAAVSNVALDGAKVYLHAGSAEPFPVLSKVIASSSQGEAAEPAPTPAPSPSPDAAAPAEAPKPWEWQVAKVRISDSTVHILSEQPTIDVGVDLTAANLASAADAVAHVALGLGLGPASIKVDGDARIAAPAFGGTIKVADLAVPPLIAVSGAIAPTVLPAATFKADLAVEAGLSAKEGAQAAGDVVRVSGTLGLSDTRVSPPGETEMSVEAKSLDVAINELSLPGIVPIGQKGGPASTVRLSADVKLGDLHVTRAGEQPIDVGAQAIDLSVSELSVPAAMAALATGDDVQAIHAVARLGINQLRAALGPDLAAQAGAITLVVNDATIATLPPGGDAAAAAPARVVAQLDLTAPQVTLAGGKQLAAGAKTIGLQVTELTLPGVSAGGPPVDTGKPLHAVATLTLAQPRAVRGDGKEFSVTAKALAVNATELAVPGVLAPSGADAPPLRADFSEIRVDGPALRITRTKEGIILPAAEPGSATAGQAAAAPSPAPASAPAPASPSRQPQVSVAALRVTKGDLNFNDRAVKPPVQTHLVPIEIDARNVRFPELAVKPLRIDITSATQGRITVSGDISPQGGALDLVVDDFSLTPFNPYATTYSQYSINDGVVGIKTTVKFSGGKYDVDNALTLHQFDLGGAEGDSFFVQQLGMPLSMILALLRDIRGTINLSIPVQVDQSTGATVDVISIMRSALRQALMGAIQSPLKLVGAVIGVGGGKSSIAPAPIAFPLGRAEPTAAGSESAERLANFLKGRPGMAVTLDTTVTVDDVRWLREQALRGEFEEEGFFSRSLGFVTQRGPRERIGTYLTARAEGGTPELSAEDAATLQKWLDEKAPTRPEQVTELAAARLTAVTSVLEANGIDASRVDRGEPSSEPEEGAPVVRISFHPVGAPGEAHAEQPNSPEEGQ